MIKAFLMKYALAGAGILILTNAGSCVLLKRYKAQVDVCRAQCLIDAQNAATEAERLTRDALERGWRVERAELEARLRLSDIAAKRHLEIAEQLARDKAIIQRRLQYALQNQTAGDWANTPVPRGVCDATARCESPRAGGGAGDEADTHSGPTPDPVLTTYLQRSDELGLTRSPDG